MNYVLRMNVLSIIGINYCLKMHNEKSKKKKKAYYCPHLSQNHLSLIFITIKMISVSKRKTLNLM